MQKIHFHNDFDVHLNFTNISTDYVSRVEFWTRKDDIYCCCKCDGSLKVEDDSNIVCYLNDHNLCTGKLNYNVIFQIPDPNYADGYKKVCQHYVSDIFLTSENGDTTVAIVKVLGDEKVTDLINRLSEFEKVFDNKQDKLEFDNTPTLGSKNVVYSDGIYNAIKNNKPDLTDYAKKTDLQGLASEQWVTDKGYLTEHQSLEGYVTETELNSKGYVPEKFDSDNYNSHIDVKRASIFLDSENWKKYVKLDPNRIIVYDKGTQGQEIYTQLTTNTLGVVKSKDGKTDLAAFLITDEGKGSLRVKDSENELNISVDGITIKEGFYEYNISLSKIKDMATKSDLEGLATENWVTNQGYITSIPSDYITESELNSKGYITSIPSDYITESELNSKGYITTIPDDYVTETELASKGYLTEHQSLDDYVKKSDLQNTSVEVVTVTPAADTEYTLNSNQYLRIIPAAAVKLTFNKSDGTGLMREYHIVIDCNTAVPTAEFKGVLWGLDNDPVFEKGKMYDIVIRYDGTNLYGSWKAYKLMGITILITTSDATAVQLNNTTYNLVAGDNSLTDSGFKTITDIGGFNSNKKITSIDFGGATIKIADLNNRFGVMSNLTKISNITIKDADDLTKMFFSDSSLKEIDVANWNTSKATNFSYMFFGCSVLTSLNLSGWDTSKATDFSRMFYYCGGLHSLNLSGWNTSNATNFYSMFNGCSGLKTLDLSGWNTSKATDFSFMFQNCSDLTSLNLSGWDTSSATEFVQMFNGCSGLTSLDVSNWDVSKVTNFGNMFRGCSDLTSLNLSGWDTSSATKFVGMFSGCSGLTSLDLSGFNTSNATNFSDMFYYCSGLTSIDLSGWNISASANINDMFSGCNALTTIKMIGCSQATIDKINSVKPASATIITE